MKTMTHGACTAALAATFALGVLGISSNAVGEPEYGSTNGITREAETNKKKTPKKKAPAIKAVNNANCPVMNAPIGSMGAGTSVTYKGYKVSLCCAGCAKKFNENPDTYLQAALADSKKQ